MRNQSRCQRAVSTPWPELHRASAERLPLTRHHTEAGQAWKLNIYGTFPSSKERSGFEFLGGSRPQRPRGPCGERAAKAELSWRCGGGGGETEAKIGGALAEAEWSATRRVREPLARTFGPNSSSRSKLPTRCRFCLGTFLRLLGVARGLQCDLT